MYQQRKMAQSLTAIYCHITFSTKKRQPLIHDSISQSLHAYMASILKNMDSPAVIINSMPDHIHILLRMSKTRTMADLVEEIKKSSSKWIKMQPNGVSSFYWQRGYSAFSISASHVNIVSRYISNQKKHHQKMTYRQEIEKLMKKYRVGEYDPSYFWD